MRLLANLMMAEMKDAGASCNEAESAKHDSIEIEVIIKGAARKCEAFMNALLSLQ